METTLFSVAYVIYAVSMFFFFGYAITRKEVLARRAYSLLVVGLFSHFCSLILRTVIARQMPDHGWYVPWSNWFESFSFLAFVIVAEYLIIQYRGDVPFLGVFITPLVFASMMAAVHSPAGTEIPVLPPALQSHWMAIHVPVMFIAYALCANAFGIGLAYLIQERQLKVRKPSSIVFRLPPLDELDGLIFKIIAFAFPLLTLGLLVGALWAYEAWGRYWGWDAKETWAFISWLVYLVYLLMRLIVGWRGRKTAYLSLAGFIVVLFTYVGVNYISDLHGFLSGDPH